MKLVEILFCSLLLENVKNKGGSVSQDSDNSWSQRETHCLVEVFIRRVRSHLFLTSLVTRWEILEKSVHLCPLRWLIEGYGHLLCQGLCDSRVSTVNIGQLELRSGVRARWCRWVVKLKI